MAPVRQDKPCHSLDLDLAELCSPILLSLHWPTVSLFTRMWNIFCHRTVAPALSRIETSSSENLITITSLTDATDYGGLTSQQGGEDVVGRQSYGGRFG